MHFSSLYFRTICILIFVITLASCRNNGGDPVQETGKPFLASDTYFVIRKDDALLAINPQSPTTSTEIAPAGAGITGAIVAPQLVPGNDGTSGLVLANSYLVYVKDGKIWRLDLGLGSDFLPEQVSSENNAFKVCWADFLPSNQSPYYPRYRYTLPNPDGDCYVLDPTTGLSENVNKSVSLDMDTATAPNASNPRSISIRENQAPILRLNPDILEAEVIGYLVREDNQDLNWYPGKDLTGTPELVASGVQDFRYFPTSQSIQNNEQFIAINNSLYSFNFDTASLSEPLYTFDSSESRNVVSSTNDGNIAYLFDGGRILTLKLGSGEPPSLLYDNSSNTGLNLSFSTNTQNYLVVWDQEPGVPPYQHYSINKQTGNRVPLFTSTSGIPLPGTISSVSNETMYHYDPATNTTEIIPLDGTKKKTVANARPYKPFISYMPYPEFNPSPYMLFTVERSSSETEVQLFNKETLMMERSLGTLPRIVIDENSVPPRTTADIENVQINGEHILFTTFASFTKRNLYYANLSQENSVLPIYESTDGNTIQLVGSQFFDTAPVSAPAPAPAPAPAATTPSSGMGRMGTGL